MLQRDRLDREGGEKTGRKMVRVNIPRWVSGGTFDVRDLL